MPDIDFCFVVNPAAGGGLAGRNWRGLQRHLEAAKITHSYYVSDHKGHGRDLARAALEAGHTNFVVVGGDGTANEVLNGLYPHSLQDSIDITLGIIPWGTGNDWARHYSLPSAPKDFVRLLQSGSSALQDIGKVSFVNSSGKAGSHFFLNCCGTGFDSYLLEKMDSPRGSRLRYFLYVLKCAYKYRGAPLQLDMEGESLHCPVLLLEICIGMFAGAGMRFAPEAVADDGLFEVLLINKLSIPQLLASLVYLYNGRINDHRAVRRWQKGAISIAEGPDQHFHCDGELVGKLPIEIEILPRTLRVIAP
jgi:diacylglycerol kinase (ATP)